MITDSRYHTTEDYSGLRQLVLYALSIDQVARYGDRAVRVTVGWWLLMALPAVQLHLPGRLIVLETKRVFALSFDGGRNFTSR